MNPGASAALMFLILQTMCAALVFLVLFAAMVFGMHKLRGVLLRFLPKAQAATQKIRSISLQVSDKIAEPILRVSSLSANVRGTIKAARNKTGL